MEKRVVLLVHGFMVHDWHDMAKFKKYMDDNPLDHTSFELVYLYERENSKTSKLKAMINTLKAKVQEKIDEGYEVILLGYSFSCGIVAKVAKEMNIKSVIYISPAVRLIKTKLFRTHIKNAFKVLKLKIKKGRKKADKIMKKTRTKGIVTLSYHISISMIKTKKYYKNSVPFLLLRGCNDEYSLTVDAYKIAKKSTAKKTSIVTLYGEEYGHFFMLDENVFIKEPVKVLVNYLKELDHE